MKSSAPLARGETLTTRFLVTANAGRGDVHILGQNVLFSEQNYHLFG
jgi:hypothetical protein